MSLEFVHVAFSLQRFLHLPAGTTFEKMMGAKRSKGKSMKGGTPSVGPKITFEGYHSDGQPLSITLQVGAVPMAHAVGMSSPTD